MPLAEKARRTSRVRTAALALGSALALTVGLAGSAQAALLTPFPNLGGGAPKQELFQPFFDYGSNGCYPAAAVDASGRPNGGLNPSGALNFPLPDRGDRFRQTLNEARPAGIGFNAWS